MRSVVREYALTADYAKMKFFKAMMKEVAKRTRDFPRYGVEISADGRRVRIPANGRSHVEVVPTMEGLGNLTRIAQLVYQATGNPEGYRNAAFSNIMMVDVDNLRDGGLAVALNTFIAVGADAWFADERQAGAYAQGCFDACEAVGMALIQGESQAVYYLMPTGAAAETAPLLAGSIVGVFPENWFTGVIEPGDFILGARSTGIHANGISLLIRKALEHPRGFGQVLADGRILGEHALIPTACYRRLVERLLCTGILRDAIKAFQPVTGGGLTSLVKGSDGFRYRIERWPKEIPLIFKYLFSWGISLKECLETYNWGIGLFVIISPSASGLVFEAAEQAGCKLEYLGKVEDGQPSRVIFEPEGGLELEYPG